LAFPYNPAGTGADKDGGMMQRLAANIIAWPEPFGCSVTAPAAGVFGYRLDLFHRHRDSGPGGFVYRIEQMPHIAMPTPEAFMRNYVRSFS
jgi:hypothetical protein